MDSVSLDSARDMQRLQQHRPNHHVGNRQRAHTHVQPLDAQQVRTPDRAGALQILKHEVFGALRARFESVAQQQSTYSPTPEPQETAGQILRAVNDVQASAGDEAPEVLDEAVLAVDEGVQQTQTILSSLGAFTSDIAEVISNIQSLIEKGLEQLQSNLGATGVQAFSADYTRTERTEIRILTQEGDVVRLRIGERSQASVDALTASDGESALSATAISLSSTSRLDIRIEGDLNESELAAITDLLANAEAIVDDFFSGDTLGAFETVGQLGFDSEQLASFSLRAAVREQFSFSGVGAQTQPPAEEPAQITPVGPPIVEDPGPVAEDPIGVSPVVEVPDPVLPVIIEGPETQTPEATEVVAPVAAQVGDSELDAPAGESGVPVYDAFQVVVDFMARVLENIKPDSQELVITQRLVVEVLDVMIEIKQDETNTESTAGTDLFKEILDSAAPVAEAA